MRRVVPAALVIVAWGWMRARAEEPALVPMPMKFEENNGAFEMKGTGVEGVAAMKGAEDFARQTFGLPAGKGIRFEQAEGLGAEGYRMAVGAKGVVIAASSDAGAFYAVETLRELAAAGEGESVKVPYCEVRDQPRYAWRGMLLDSCRHFFPKETVERFIDLMALHKMNVLQWHLTDDQGWRIEIRKYPKLTEIGAWRVGEKMDVDSRKAPADQERYGGFYTQEDIKEVVVYAAARHVTIVPEIEMPGHAMAALAAYPELACTDGPFEVGNRRGVYKDVYCAGKEGTFTFLENVLDEVCALFPGEYVHVGGDECPKDRWKECPLCQARMKAEGLKDENELQSYFIKRIEAYLETKHKKLIGWDEILEGGLPAGAAVTSWRGMEGGRVAAKAGHEVVMCPEFYCYFDHQADLPDAAYHDATVPLDRVYAFDPAAGLSAEEAQHVMGAQGNLWSEFIGDQKRLEFMAFPRECALAEVLWSQRHDHFEEFAKRMQGHLATLQAIGVNINDDELLHAEKLRGGWSVSEAGKNHGQGTWTSALDVARPGVYEVRVECTAGKGEANIDGVLLAGVKDMKEGEVVSQDMHAGMAGGRTRANKYFVTVKEVPAGELYMVLVRLRAGKGADLNGEVFWRRVGDVGAATQP